MTPALLAVASGKSGPVFLIGNLLISRWFPYAPRSYFAAIALASRRFTQEGMLAMLRQLLVVAVMLWATTLFSGCRACSSCHDYDRPVADCDCGACGCGRAGSVLSGCHGEHGGAPEVGTTGQCATCQ